MKPRDWLRPTERRLSSRHPQPFLSNGRDALRALFLIFLLVPAVSAQTTTVDFDNPAPAGSPGTLLNGVFQGIDFGTGRWRWEAAFGPDATNNIYFDSGTGTLRTFSFASGPRMLNSIRVFSLSAGMLTLTDDVGQTRTQAITVGTMQLVTTGWTQPSTTVAVTFTSGWDLGVDDINYTNAAPNPLPTVSTLSPSPVVVGSNFAETVPAGYALRFHGNGVNAPDHDRVKIRIDNPPGPPADVGATDFTLEFWMKAAAEENPAAAQTCGANINWIYGNIVFDRDRYNQDRKFGLSIAGGRIIFGASGDGTGDWTICGTTDVLDSAWHHIAVQRRRSDGWMWLFVDGRLEAVAQGPEGDISYPDDAAPGDFCNGPCTNDGFLVIGAEKHDAGAQYPSYSGLIDEVRLSDVLRYPTDGNFDPPREPFAPDASTRGLYHFDEGQGDLVTDSSTAAGGPSTGVRNFGGAPAGPEWVADTPFVGKN
jgi:hypothetical protein